MKRLVVRYKTKPDASATNAQLIQEVFKELSAKAPAGVRTSPFPWTTAAFYSRQHAGGRGGRPARSLS